METLTTIVQYAYLNCKRNTTEIISSTTNRERAMNVVLVVFLLVIFDHANVIGIFVVFLLLVGRIEDIVSVWIISDSGTRLTRQYRHLVHCIYNKFFVLDIFIYYSLEYIYILHSKPIYLFDISTRRTYSCALYSYYLCIYYFLLT